MCISLFSTYLDTRRIKHRQISTRPKAKKIERYIFTVFALRKIQHENVLDFQAFSSSIEDGVFIYSQLPDKLLEFPN